MGGLWEIKERISHMPPNSPKRFLTTVYEAYLREWGGWIGPYSTFEDEPYFPHGLSGIFIADETRIGKNCVIMQQVTIGSNTLLDSKKPGQPEIGDDCFIGAGAKIIGGIKIGNNCRIGANCVVFTDIPDNSVIVLQPPKIIARDALNNRFYTKKNGNDWVYFDDGEWVIEENKENIAVLNRKFK